MGTWVGLLHYCGFLCGVYKGNKNDDIGSTNKQRRDIVTYMLPIIILPLLCSKCFLGCLLP